jgi:hypothetical protein
LACGKVILPISLLVDVPLVGKNKSAAESDYRKTNDRSANPVALCCASAEGRLRGIEVSPFHPAVAAWQMLWRGKQEREKSKNIPII